MIIIGFMETFAAGWVYGLPKTIKNVGQGAVISYMIANFGSVVVACGIWYGVPPARGGIWGGFVALVTIYLISCTIALFFLKRKMEENPDKWTWSSIIWELSFKNIFDLKNRIEPSIKYIPSLWCILIKQFLPQVLIIIFVNLAQSKTSSGAPMFGGYGGYSTKPYQILGVLTFVFAASLFVVGMLFPIVYEGFALAEGHESLDEVEQNVHKGDATFHKEENSEEETGGNNEESSVNDPNAEEAELAQEA